MVSFIDEHREELRGRADLQAADRPVDLLRAEGPPGRSRLGFRKRGGSRDAMLA